MSQEPSGTDGPRILVPLDQSERAEKALDLAAALLRTGGGSLIAMTVPALYHYQVAGLQPYPGGRRPPDHIAPPDELLAESRREAEGYMQRLATRLEAEGLSAECRVIDALPATAIVDLAARREVSMIVIATHGRRGLGRIALGSVTDKVLQAAPCPVLVLRGSEQRDILRMDHLLVPLDGSALAEQSLAPAADLARRFGARLTLCQVLQPAEMLPERLRDAMGELAERQRAAAEDYLEAQAETLRSEGLDVATELAYGEDVAETLIERVEREDVDLVAMTTHGRGGLRRWAYGSVADRLVRHSQAPVLVVRAGGG